MTCFRWRVFGLSGPRPPTLISGLQPLGPSPHKSFNQLNFLLVNVQSLWSWAHYFQWFTGFVDFILCPTDKHMFKINNKKISLISWMCSKLKINRTWHCSAVFVVDFDHSQLINIMQQVFVSRVWKTNHNIPKTQKAMYLFRNESCKTYFI